MQYTPNSQMKDALDDASEKDKEALLSANGKELDS